MLRMSMNEMTTYNWSFEKDVREFARAGYAGIGVWRQKLSDYGEEAGIRLLVKSGLRVSNLLWAGGFTGSEGRNLDDSLRDAVSAIQLANCMDADCLVVYTGSRGGHTANHARRLVESGLRELVQVANDYEVAIGVEPMHENCAGEWTFLTEIDETLQLLDDIGSRHLKLVFDTYHFGSMCLKRIEEIAERVAVVHIGDAKQTPNGEQNRCLLGEGNIPNHDIVAALQSGGYDGFLDVELFGEDVQHQGYDRVIEHSRNVFGC